VAALACRPVVAASLGMLLLLGSCGGTPQERIPPGPRDPRKNLALHNTFLGRVERDSLERGWHQDLDPEAKLPPGKIGLRPLLDLRDQEVAALASLLEEAEDLRTLSVIRDRAVHIQAGMALDVKPILERIYKVRRTRLGEEEVFLNQTLMETLDPEARRQAWTARAKVAFDLAPLMRKLAHARNGWAAERSALPFPDLMAPRRGYDTGTARRLRRHVARVLLLSEEEKARLKEPWDPEGNDPALARRMARYLDAGGCLERTSAFLELAGLPPRPEGLVIVIRPGSGRFWPFSTYAVDPPGDIRMLLTPGAGIYRHWSVLHEFGHAAQALLAPVAGPAVLRRPASPAVAESCAKVAERLAYAPEWLRLQGVPEEEIEAMVLWERASERARMRSILADVEFEESLYQDPEGNLDTIHARIRARVAGVRIPPDYPVWALNRSLAFEPLERIDYLLARCAQAAIYRRLRALPGGLLGKEARRVLREDVLSPAAGLRYEEWFERATGHAPECTAWLQDVARLGAGTQAAP